MLMLYRPLSEGAREAERYVTEFSKLHREEFQMLDIDSVEGITKASLYDIVSTPAILITRDTGEMVALWQDAQLPLMNEVLGYLST